ncbi:MAG: hypothetical protein ACRDQH_16100 [Pseudonocardiaceae bacterium]
MVTESIEAPTVIPNRRILSADRLAGAGGIVFAVTVIIQNVVRAGGPSFTATPATVAAYFADHRAAGLLPLGLFPLGMVALLCFAAGIRVRARDLQSRWWASVGAFAAVTIAGLFAVVNTIEIVIAAQGRELVSSPQVVRALWTIHSGAFGLNLTAIAIALLGLSRAAHAAALIPRSLAVIAVPGAACLFTAAIFTVSIVNGGKWLYLGYAGFVIWGVFLVVAGIALVTGRSATSLPVTEVTERSSDL